MIAATDLYALHSLSQPCLVPGGVIAVDTQAVQATDDYRSRLWFYPENGAARLLGVAHQHDTAPQWCGDQLAFLSHDTAGKSQVFTQGLHGEAPVQRTWLADGVARFFGDADGWWLQACAPAASERPHAVRLTRLHFHQNGAGLRREDGTYRLYHQGFAAQDCKLVYTSPHAFTLAAAGRHAMALQWEDDAAFTADHGPQTVVALFDPKRRDVTPIVGGRLAACAFSPDGNKLLLCGDPGDGTAVFDTLFYYDLTAQALTAERLIFPADGPEIGNLTTCDSQYQLSGVAARWQDDAHVVFQYAHAGQVRLGVSDLFGDWRRLATPDATITDFAVAGERLAFTLTGFTTPSQLWDRRGLFVDPNAAWVAAHTPQAPTPFAFNRAGFTIHGWYLPPRHAHGSHPAVLAVHGGPEGAYGDAFFHELQVLCSQGYGVIFVNPRGSSGYGAAFAAAVRGDYGGEDYQDLMAAVDVALAAFPEIDATRLFMYGGSYGGFMADWIETHTARFKALIAQRGISDWTAYFGTSDLGYFFATTALGAAWQPDGSHLKRWLRQSPVTTVANATTPLLLMHSADDRRVPLGQSTAFYTALKLQNVPVELLIFPASDHNLSRTGLPNLRIERLDAMCEWFARYSSTGA